MRCLPVVGLIALLLLPVAARAQEEAQADATTPPKALKRYIVTARIIELPLWRFNEVLKQHPVALSEAETAEGPKFLHGATDPATRLALEHKLVAYGSLRDYGKLIVEEGTEGGLTVAGRKEVIAGSEPTLNPKRGVVFKTLTDTTRVSGLSLKALCAETAAGVLCRMEVELLNNIEAVGPGGDRTAPTLVKRTLTIAELVPDKGAAVLVPPLAWNQVGNEMDPRVQALLIGVREAGPTDLL
jgi:hypothetical protein